MGRKPQDQSTTDFPAREGGRQTDRSKMLTILLATNCRPFHGLAIQFDSDNGACAPGFMIPPASQARAVLFVQSHTNLHVALIILLGLPRRLNSWEVADHKDQVQKPEGEPDRCDDMKPDQEQDQTWRQEHRGVTQQPEAIGSPGVQRPFSVAHRSAKRAPVVVQRREHE